jgi:hypothetical protein
MRLSGWLTELFDQVSGSTFPCPSVSTVSCHPGVDLVHYCGLLPTPSVTLNRGKQEQSLPTVIGNSVLDYDILPAEPITVRNEVTSEAIPPSHHSEETGWPQR